MKSIIGFVWTFHVNAFFFYFLSTDLGDGQSSKQEQKTDSDPIKNSDGEIPKETREMSSTNSNGIYVHKLECVVQFTMNLYLFALRQFSIDLFLLVIANGSDKFQMFSPFSEAAKCDVEKLICESEKNHQTKIPVKMSLRSSKKNSNYIFIIFKNDVWYLFVLNGCTYFDAFNAFFLILDEHAVSNSKMKISTRASWSNSKPKL